MDDQNKPPNSDPSPLEPWIDPALEARIVALILGEASDFEKSELQSILDAQPELKAFHDRLLSTHRSVEQSQLRGTDSDWKLPAEKRDALLEKFRTPAETPSAPTEQIIHTTQKHRVIALAPWLGLAAAIMLLLAVVIPFARRGTSVMASAKHSEPPLAEIFTTTLDSSIDAKAAQTVATAETTAEQILGESLYDNGITAVNGTSRQLGTDWSGVMDGGYDSDIDRSYRYRRDADFVNGDQDGPPKDFQDKHGTQMAGILIPRHNSGGIAGLAPAADLDRDGFGIAAEPNVTANDYSKSTFAEESPNLTGTRLFNDPSDSNLADGLGATLADLPEQPVLPSLARDLRSGDSRADYDRKDSHRFTIAAAGSDTTDALGLIKDSEAKITAESADAPSVAKNSSARATATKPGFAPPATPAPVPAMESNELLFATLDDGKESLTRSTFFAPARLQRGGDSAFGSGSGGSDSAFGGGGGGGVTEADEPLEALGEAQKKGNSDSLASAIIPATPDPTGQLTWAAQPGIVSESKDSQVRLDYGYPVKPFSGASSNGQSPGQGQAAAQSKGEPLAVARQSRLGGKDAIVVSDSVRSVELGNQKGFEDTKRPTDDGFVGDLDESTEESLEKMVAENDESKVRYSEAKPKSSSTTASLADATVSYAHELALSGGFNEARSRLGFVLSDEIAPNNANAKKILERLDDPEYYNPAVTPKHIEDVKKVERNLSLATGFYDTGDFDKAEMEFNEVLRTDKYNETARRGMEEVELARQKYFKSGRDHTRGKMLSKVDELWEFNGRHSLTANSNAPEITMFGTPLVSIWPTNVPSVDLVGEDGSNQNISGFAQISGNQVPNLSAPDTSDDAPLVASQQSDSETYKGKRAWGAHGGVRLFSADPSVTGRVGEVVLPAHRGRIFDANGEELVENVPTREVVISGVYLISPVAPSSGVADRNTLPHHGTPFNGNAGAAKSTGIDSPDNWAYTTVRHWGLVNDGALFDGSRLDRPEVVVNGKSYWTDDESSKVNINVASEGAFWDIPRTDANSAGKKEELYRNPGHPGGISLESIQFKTGLADAEQQLEQRLEESRETMLGLMEDSGIVDLGTETPQWAETELREERKSGVEYIAARDEYKRTKQQLSEIREKIAESKPAATKQKAVADLSLETLTSAEPFSTFSLNVSDVSFKLAKTALLENGTYPDAAKVRIEEFVNAFDYGDPCPTPSQKVACQIDQAAHPFLQQRNLMRVSMRTAAEGRAASQPLRLTILLDKSGSMERADREESVLRTMQALAKHLGPADKITAIAFARQPHLITEGLTGDRAKELVNLVAATPSEGGTNLEEALTLADTLATRQFEDGATNRIVLITDGAANLGDADPESLKEKVIELRQRGIAFDACGVGADGFNDATLEALTRKGDGRYYFIDRPEDADESFVRQLAGALRPAAKNVKVQVKFNPERVTRYRLAGFEKHRLNKEDFRNDKVDAAEMAAAEAGNAVYHFEADPQGEGDVGEVFVRFLDTNTNQMVERSWPIPYQPKAPRLEEAKPSMQIAATAAFLAEKLKGAAASETIQLEELAQITNQLRTHQDPRVQSLIQMVEKARSLK